MVSKAKGRHNTIYDFIKKVFEQWLEWRDTISFMEEAYTKQSNTIEGYVKQIEELKKNQQQQLLLDPKLIKNLFYIYI